MPANEFETYREQWEHSTFYARTYLVDILEEVRLLVGGEDGRAEEATLVVLHAAGVKGVRQGLRSWSRSAAGIPIATDDVADLDDETLASDGESEDVAAAAAHESVHEAGQDALRLPCA